MHHRPPLSRRALCRRALCRRALPAAALTLSLAALAGCSSDEQLAPAPAASSAECTRALAAAPATVLDRARAEGQGVGLLGWGSPAIVLRCGLAEPGPTTLTCLAVDGVDWVIDEKADPMTAVSYGRSPAVEVRMPRSYEPSDLPAALVDLRPVAEALPKGTRRCIG